jgi:pyridoxine/pyridoxamine 5'-phosphate oxidase
LWDSEVNAKTVSTIGLDGFPARVVLLKNLTGRVYFYIITIIVKRVGYHSKLNASAYRFAIATWERQVVIKRYII